MTSNDDADRLALTQGLMVEITARLEGLIDRAARLQRAQRSDPALSDDIAAVKDLAGAHARLLPPRPIRARSKT